jgi:hypothetical protein
MIVDYNGWTDLPEAEREALDILGLSSPVPSERRSRAPVKVLAGGRYFELPGLVRSAYHCMEVAFSTLG